MKPLVPVLFLSVALPALCQTSQRPSQFFPTPPSQQSPHLWSDPRVFPFDRNMPAPGLTIQPPAPRFANPRLDEHIIHRPPQGAFSQQQPHAPLARNFYPDLKLLPIETARMEPIPVYFPKFKVEQIPLTAPDAKMVPVQTSGVKPDE